MDQMVHPADRPKPKLLDRVRHQIRTRHYSRRTEKAYIHWIKRFIFFHDKRHPAEMGEAEVTRFLSGLAVDGKVAASTQNQAVSALLFLYKAVLQQPLPWLDTIAPAKRPGRLPVVLSREEVQGILTPLPGTTRRMGPRLSGAGLRLLEGCRLRVKDVDCAAKQILVRHGTGDTDRATRWPGVAASDLTRHLEAVPLQHPRDLDRGAGWVELPGALGRKYPNAGRAWGGPWVFPATRVSRDRDTGQRRRHPLPESVVPRVGNKAVRRARVAKPATPHTFRPSCATHRLEDGYDIRTVQELLGHADVSTTRIYPQVLNRGWGAVRSPADRLPPGPPPAGGPSAAGPTRGGGPAG